MRYERSAYSGQISHMTISRYLVASALRRLQRQYGYRTDTDLAHRAGVSRSHLCSCLSGRYPAGPKVVNRLLRALPGVGVDDISYLAHTHTHREAVPSRPTSASRRVFIADPDSQPAA